MSLTLLPSLTSYIVLKVVSKMDHQLSTMELIVVVVVLGSNKICSFDGTVIVNRSIALQQPVIYVSLNYR